MTKQRFTMPVERAIAQLVLLGCSVKEQAADRVILYVPFYGITRDLLLERNLSVRNGRVKPMTFHRLRQNVLAGLSQPPNQGTTQP